MSAFGFRVSGSDCSGSRHSDSRVRWAGSDGERYAHVSYIYSQYGRLSCVCLWYDITALNEVERKRLDLEVLLYKYYYLDT
jgi:hypothetical protein